eukprot:GHVU01054036.1.p4 GENE.GHVU01054036.1~~GHVU01054036.1.p4  ORF type:complete len:125 (-),score=6.01 GHVU01054036.1:22-396(-)
MGALPAAAGCAEATSVRDRASRLLNNCNPAHVHSFIHSQVYLHTYIHTYIRTHACMAPMCGVGDTFVSGRWECWMRGAVGRRWAPSVGCRVESSRYTWMDGVWVGGCSRPDEQASRCQRLDLDL